MSILRYAYATGALLLGGSLQAAQIEEPCKNHYILDDCPHAAPKSPNTFRLRKLYSDPSGNVQVVQLLESAGLDDQHRWRGLTLVSTDRHGVSKRVTFSTDLPSAATAHRPVILTTFGASDFTIPPRFLPMDGGTLEFAGVDQWTFGPLPENGLFDLFRPTAPPQIPNETPTQFLTFENEVWEPRVRDELLVEFHHPATDRYFVTMFAQDFEAIDSGRVPGWVRTGDSMRVWINNYYNPGDEEIGPHAQPEGLLPVCRLFLPPPQGPSHFFSASLDECALALRNIPGLILETDQAFLAFLPDTATGTCAQYASPVYRLWNPKEAMSHRFTPSKAARDAMVERGWVSEGWGQDGVAMCTFGYREAP